MHHADSECVCIIRIVDFNSFSVLANFALFRMIQSEKHTHKSAFARTVFTQKSMNLALFELQCDIVVCNDSRKPLCDADHFNGIFASICSFDFLNRVFSKSYKYYLFYHNFAHFSTHCGLLFLLFH